MRIILRVYKEIRMGNLSTMIIDIPNNKITVRELKEKIYKKYKINPDKQKLTYRLCNKKLITLTDSFPLNYFYIKEYSMIFLEFISNISQIKTEEKKNLAKRNSATYKYMNMLGYFLPDSKTFQKTGIGGIYKKERNRNSFFDVDNRKNSSALDYESEEGSIIFVDEENEYEKKEFNSENKLSFKKSLDFSENINNNNLLKKGLFSQTNLVEKLCIYIRKNNLEQVKILLSQYNTNNYNNISLNLDFNDSSDFNYSSKNIRKISAGNGQNQKRISQAKTNNKTSSSFNSGNSLSITNEFNICEMLNKDGWNSLHYASYLGYNEILDYILNKYNTKPNSNININLTNNEGWSPLLLAVFKQHVKCVEILLANENINVNYLGDMGTALHIACRKNNRQIVSKLICKADPKIKDKYKKIPMEYTSDKGIIKLISKLIYKKYETIDKNNKLYEELKKFIQEYKHILIYKKTKENNNTQNNKINISELKGEKLPKKVPIFFGELEQQGGFFSSNKKKYIEINPLKGILKIFKSLEDYPKNPNQIINLIDIIKCSKCDEQNIQKNYFFFEISFYLNKGSNNDNELINSENSNNNGNNNNNNKICSEKYFVHSAKACDEIVILINKEINFNKYWNNLIKKYKDKKAEIIKFLNNEKFNTLKFELESKKSNNFILLNDLGKEVSLDETFFKLDEENNNNKNNDNNLDKEKSSEKENNEKTIRRKISAAINTDDYDANTKTIINFNSFEILELIGGGSFGKIFKVKQKNTSKIYAMKVLNKSYLIQKKLLRYAITECNILKNSDCPFILKLHYSFQTPENLYMILDYCPIGDLSYQIQINLFEEEEAKFYIAELIIAIEYLHKRDIIYRDMKPENILIDEDGHIKLADFGLAKENVKNDTPNKTFCGSPQYLSPEMLSKEGTTKSSDIYGIGAILFEMVTGAPPFYSQDVDLMYKNISENKLMFPEIFSEELKDLLRKMLDKNPKQRIGIGNDKQDLKNHPFFADIDWDLIFKKKITPPVEMVDIKEEYDLKEKVDFKDEDYNSNNKFIKRIPGFTFIKNDK